MELGDSLPGFRLDTKVNYGVFGTLTCNSLYWNWEVSGLAEGLLTFTFRFLFLFTGGNVLLLPTNPLF